MRTTLILAAALAVLAVSGAGATEPHPAACAARAPIELPVNPWPAAHSELAPPGASEIRLCRYNGFTGRQSRGLAATTLVSQASAVAELVGELDALKAFSGKVFCPMDNGVEIDMLLSYSSGRAVSIRVEPTGCETVSNGSVTRTAATTAAGTRLLATVDQLTHYKPNLP